ncbi:HD-GYP domain-containing protein [Texcoconibacillus texcoconensis]|uniref:Putative nucleotidyltransferase with HDIG domain n=1 Tax=Texcoconibacillus texcoconensis TaxID=1095777 RepID=A0A840QQE6_9BACI|nr:HD-GYP domain-containing protein [Texcoconibacillus texcoconensis]MBB5173527.1 putative nucleotidyltransferase with HDIG domain [Texcoconibacillus texcoconensis]
MRIKSIDAVSDGDVLGRAIINDEGQALLQAGVTLTKNMATRIKARGVSYIYIEDDLTDDIVPEQPIREKTRTKAVKTIKDCFTFIEKETVLKKSINVDEMADAFTDVITQILNDIQSNQHAISILSDVYCYDSYVFHHSLNVTVYSVALAKRLGYNGRQLEEIGLGAILHDVGKMAVPSEILQKPGKLSDEEFDAIKYHAEAGFEFLRKSHRFSLLTAHCAYQHHERLNGTGYPRRLKGNDIHPYAQIIGVADVFDAVTSHRVYRKAMLPNEGLELLYSSVDTQFSKELVQTFAKTIAVYPNGLEVTLSNGLEGVVAQQNEHYTTRPIVRVLKKDGETLAPYDLDLLEELDVTIVHCQETLADEM